MIAKIIDKLKLKLNRDTGPIIQGSLVTKIVEQRFYESNWHPKDIDLLCHKSMVDKVDKHLEKISYKTQVDNFKYYWIEGLPIPASLIPFNGPVSLHCKIADFTCNAMLYDGVEFLYHSKSIEDIEHKVIRLINIQTLFGYNMQSYNLVLTRYNKLVQRGYVDKDNLMFKKINDHYQYLPSLKRIRNENS